MAVSVVVGGQFGSEGKGKVAQYLALERDARAVVRVGGSNSGHTGLERSGERRVLRHLPTAALLPDVLCLIGAGSYVDPSVLLAEINATELDPHRLLIDQNAFVITEEDREWEARMGLPGRIGSTGSGTGGSVLRRVQRNAGDVTIRDIPELAPFVGDANKRLRQLVDAGERVIVEGTQGFGLSVLHAPFYPHVTARDTSAAGAIAEAGLSPRDVDEVVLVIRAFPIRVGGDSGPLQNEIDWETVTRESGASEALQEFTSVTGRLRRIARFDPRIVRQAISVNNPSLLALNHIDYVDARCSELGTLTKRARSFVSQVSSDIDRRVDLVGLASNAMVPLERGLARVAS